MLIISSCSFFFSRVEILISYNKIETSKDYGKEAERFIKEKNLLEKIDDLKKIIDDYKDEKDK